MTTDAQPASRPKGAAPGDLAVVLTGGGARAAYQVGVLRTLGRRRPGLRIPIITGVSAGAINAIFLAAHQGPLGEAVEELAALWRRLELEEIFRVDTPSIAKHFFQWSVRLVSGGSQLAPEVRGLVDPSPLETLLRRTLKTVNGEVLGVADNLEREQLKAVALTTVNYSTGQTVTWVQGREIQPWRQAARRAVTTRLSVQHVMASSSLPLFFPAVRLGESWYGDGGIRLAAPLSPALHLGASRILAISTRYARSEEEAERPVIAGYPPPAQILGNLMNAIFLDVLDQDILRTQRLNRLLKKLPPEKREGMRPVEVEVLRPSEDLGRLAADYESALPRSFRFLTRGLGTRETQSPDFLSLLLFQPDYLQKLLEIGERDAEERVEELCAIVDC